MEFENMFAHILIEIKMKYVIHNAGHLHKIMWKCKSLTFFMCCYTERQVLKIENHSPLAYVCATLKIESFINYHMEH